MTEYRWADEKDYNDIIEMANYAFDPKNHTGDYEKDISKESYFPRILPKLYQNIKTAPMHVLAVEDGKIVGLVGNFELSTKVSGEELFVIGIGTVSTHPERRRAGNMKKLMAMSIEKAKQRNADYMILGGLRQRYEHWGFECAGLMPQYRFTKTCCRHIYGENAVFGYEFRPLQKEDTEYIKMERLLRTAKPVSLYHEKEQEYNILFSMGMRPYVILKNGEFFGTFMLSGEKGVFDLRITEPEETGRVLNDLLKTDIPENGGVNISHIPLFETVMHRILTEQAEGYQMVNNIMVKVLNYERTVRAYLKLAAGIRPLSDGEAVLSFENGETLKITVKDNVPQVLPYEGGDKPEALPELTAVNLLFGPGAVYSDFGTGISPAARSWFPLPVFQYMCDEV